MTHLLDGMVRQLAIVTPIFLVSLSALGGICSATLSKWKADNILFYNRLSYSDFVNRQHQCGLAHCPDLRQPEVMALLKAQEKESGSVLEIGGGFGRVVSYIRNETTIPRIEVIEHSSAYASFLSTYYDSSLRIRVHHHSVINPLPNIKVNGALWMWAGFFELAPRCKVMGLRNVHDMLNEGGFLILDMPPITEQMAKTVVFNKTGDFIDLQMNDAPNAPTIHIHILSEHQVIETASNAGFRYVKSVRYTTPSKNRAQRTTLIFVKE